MEVADAGHGGPRLPGRGEEVAEHSGMNFRGKLCRHTRKVGK